MPLRAVRWAVLVLLLLGAVGHPDLRAEDVAEPPGLSEADARRMKKEIRARVKEWWRHRKRLAVPCPECKGSGKVRWKGGRSGPLVACPKCDARKTYVDEEEYRRCFFEMLTPAFRLQKEIEDRLDREYEAACRGKPFPVVVKRYTLKEIELVDASHAFAYVERNRESVARPQRWILAKEPGEEPTWFVFDAAADGPWPGAVDPEGGTAPVPAAPEATSPPPRPPEPTSRPVRPVPHETTPRPSDPPRGPSDRASFADSQALVDKWTAERSDMTARVIRIQLGLDGVEGHAETVTQAKAFLAEIRGWLEDGKEPYERAKEDVEGKGIGLLMSDRVAVNTIHFKAFRRLELVERMLVVVVPGLRD